MRSLGYEDRDLSGLIKLFESPLASAKPKSRQGGYLDHRQLLRDLRNKPFQYWQDRLQNNAFEYKNLFNKDGTFTKILSTSHAHLDFQLAFISRKVLEASKH